MAKRKATKFKGKSDLGGGKFGLHTANGSYSDCEIEGENLDVGDDVVATCTKLPNAKWTGKLDTISNSGKKGTSKLQCANLGPVPEKKDKTKDTDQVTVTVGTAPNTSDPYTEPSVEVAP